MIKLFGKLSYVLCIIVFGALLSIGIVENVWDEPSYIITLGSVALLSLLQIYFTNQCLKLLHYAPSHEVQVIDDLLSFENNILVENKLGVKILGVLCAVAFMILLVLMIYLFIQIADRMIMDLRYDHQRNRIDYTEQAFFYSILVSMPLSVTTIWFNLNMFKSKRIKEK